ncbi:hypothetical protein EVG20_g11710, partial [Dentipellis fragilis]
MGTEQTSKQLLDDLLIFGKQKTIFWIETMNLIKARQESYNAIKDITLQLSKYSISEELQSVMIAIERLTRSFTQTPVSLSTPHLYISCLATEFATTMQIPQKWKDSFEKVPTIQCISISNHGGVLTRISTQDIVTSTAFSPDGAHIVSSSSDNTVYIWDAITGEELKQMYGHTGWVRSVAFSSDGTHIVSGSDDNTVRIWDPVTGEVIKQMHGHTDDVNSVAFSSDGTHIVSGSCDKTVRIWDAVTGEELKQIDGHTNSVESVAFSSDGAHIVSGSYDNT